MAVLGRSKLTASSSSTMREKEIEGERRRGREILHGGVHLLRGMGGGVIGLCSDFNFEIIQVQRSAK